MCLMPVLVKHEFSDVDETFYQWYSIFCSKNIFPGDPQVSEKARNITECLSKHDLWVQMGGLISGKNTTIQGGSQYVANLVMYLFLPGKRGFPRS